MTQPTDQEQAQKAREMMQAVHEDKCATINGRDYNITKLNHIKRRKVFAFFTRVQTDLQRGDFWWLESKEWQEVEAVIENAVTFDGNLLSRTQGHWEAYPGDYILFVQTMLGAMSFPFLPESSGA
jgi:hypothetical protein